MSVPTVTMAANTGMRYLAKPCVVYFIFVSFGCAECEIIPPLAGDQIGMDVMNLPDFDLQ
jgi:hypothetical protein